MKRLKYCVLAVLVIFSFLGCSEDKSSLEAQESKRIEFVKSEIEKYLREVNYNTKVYSIQNKIIITGKNDFTDEMFGNLFLTTFIIHRFFEENPHYFNNNEKKIWIEIKYPKVIHTSELHVREELFNKTDKYWKFVKHAIKNFTMYDCTYYNLTSQISREETNFSFKGNLWQLIVSLALEEKDSKINFLSFYNWSKIPYSEKLKFNQQKLDFYVEYIGLDPKKINDLYIDSLYKANGFKSYSE